MAESKPPDNFREHDLMPKEDDVFAQDIDIFNTGIKIAIVIVLTSSCLTSDANNKNKKESANYFTLYVYISEIF